MKKKLRDETMEKPGKYLCQNHNTMHYKSKQAQGFFDEPFRLEKLNAQKDPLEK